MPQGKYERKDRVESLGLEELGYQSATYIIDGCSPVNLIWDICHTTSK